jgi:hypothetical protein
MFWLVVVCFFLRGSFESDNELAEHISFGFEEGGTFTITVSSTTADNLRVNFVKEGDVKSVRSMFDNPPVEPLSLIYHDFDSVSATFSDIINESAVYYLFYQANYSDDFDTFTAEYKFRNPNSLFDSRYFPLSYLIPISFTLFGILLISWFINWILNIHVQIGLHYLVSLTFVFFFIYRLFILIQYFESIKKDLDFSMTVLEVIFMILSECSKYFLFLLASKGFCILRDSIPFLEFILSLITSFCFVISEVFLYYVDVGSWNILILLFGGLCLFLYIQDMLRSLSKVGLYIAAHMYIISRRGINSKTTPIFSKFLKITIYLK